MRYLSFSIFAYANLALMLMITTACSPSKTSNAAFELNQNSKMLSPAPQDQSTLDAQVSRYRGQTLYISPNHSYRGIPMNEAATADKSAKSLGGEREIQESDIYKIGQSGTKLLYLLNNYRGLQIVSFEDGADKPKIVGRVAATGNYPDDMYFDKKNDRLLVLENVWHNTGASNWEEKTRIVVYNVKTATAPEISEVIEVNGSTRDSRLVGDVLYLVGTQRDTSDTSKYTGFVQSFNVTKSKIKSVQRENLALPTVYGEKMNIIESEENGKAKYYLVAVLSQNLWGWWDRQSVVEVVDISDENGKISRVMLASARGQILERSQTNIINGTLLVTSNFLDNKNVRRIAVETFTLPVGTSEVLTENEAQFRKLYIDRELSKVAPQDKEAKEAALLADAQLGLKGRFVRQADGTLKKTVPDSVVTVGDTTGLHASLQDVRYENGLMFAFWVPANNIDPLDLFDISAPEKGVKYLGRLQFDGWVSRAIPMTVQGRQFVLGLGFVVPAVNNNNGVRHAQAILFEIINLNGKPKAVDVAQLTFSNQDAWTNFNSADRYIEVRFDSEGKGQVLFETYQLMNNQYMSGGKLLYFDVNAVIAGKDGLTEGGLLQADSGWLRRVFTNPEIAKINTFTDESLAVFNSNGLANATGVETAIAQLELARNIVGYESLGVGKSQIGVQIVNNYNWRNNSSPTTELRLTNPSSPDAEMNRISKTVLLKGNIKTRVVKGFTMYVGTTEDANQQDTVTGNWNFTTTHRIYKITVSPLGVITSQEDVSWQTSNSNDSESAEPMKVAGAMSIIRPWFRFSTLDLIELPGGEIVASDSKEMKLVSQTGPLSVSTLTENGCNSKDRHERVLKTIDGGAYYLSTEHVEDSSRQLNFSRNFMAVAKLNKTEISCGTEYNIPGEPVTIDKNSVLITRDQWAVEIIAQKQEWDNKVTYYYMTRNKSGLTSAKLENGTARLIDQIEQEDNGSLSSSVVDQGRLAVLTSTYQSGWWGANSYEHEFLDVRTDADGFLTKEATQIQNEAEGTLSSAMVFTSPVNATEKLLVVRSWNGFFVLKLTNNGRPTFVKIQREKESGGLEDEVEFAKTRGYISFEDGAVNLNSSFRTLELSLGFGGVDQYSLKLN